jgi:hypothetical protein
LAGILLFNGQSILLSESLRISFFRASKGNVGSPRERHEGALGTTRPSPPTPPQLSWGGELVRKIPERSDAKLLSFFVRSGQATPRKNPGRIVHDFSPPQHWGGVGGEVRSPSFPPASGRVLGRCVDLELCRTTYQKSYFQRVEMRSPWGNPRWLPWAPGPLRVPHLPLSRFDARPSVTTEREPTAASSRQEPRGSRPRRGRARGGAVIPSIL